MNILIISQYAGGPMGDRPRQLAHRWTPLGDRVAIVTADPGQGQDPEIKRGLEKKTLDGVEYLFLPIPPNGGEGEEDEDGERSSFAKRLYGLAPQIARELAPDVVVAASGHPWDALGARRIARRARGGFVFELRENGPDSREERGGRPDRRARGALGAALGKSDRVVSLLPRGAEYLKALGVPPDKAVCIPDFSGLPPADRGLSPHLEEALDHLRACYDFLVLYQGDLAPERALGRLVDAAKLLEGQSLAVVILGGGRGRGALLRQMREVTAANVYLLDGAEEGERPELYRRADCLYYGDGRSAAVRYGVGSQALVELMAWGTPVVTALDTDQSPVELAGCGLNAREGDAAALARALARMRDTPPARRRAMGERGRAFVQKNHDPQVLSQAYRSLLEETVRQK